MDFDALQELQKLETYEEQAGRFYELLDKGLGAHMALYADETLAKVCASLNVCHRHLIMRSSHLGLSWILSMRLLRPTLPLACLDAMKTHLP